MITRMRKFAVPRSPSWPASMGPAHPALAPVAHAIAGAVRRCALAGLHAGTLLVLAPGAFAQPATMTVSTVRVEGATLLDEGRLAALTAGVKGEGRSLADLNAAAARIQRAYRDAGYGGVVAFIPPQDFAGGAVVVRVVEGKLAAVRVRGNTHFDTANVRAGLPHLREGTTPPVRAVDRDIQLTNDNPAKHVKVSLTPGAQPGGIDANVDVTDSAPLQYLFGYNNTGNRATGRHRVSVGVQHANMFGRDHVGTLQYQTSPEDPGRVRIASASYRLPLYAHAATFDAIVAHSSVGIATTATVAGPLSFTGKGTIVGLRLNRYLDRIGEYDHHLTFGLDWRDYEDDCSLGSFGRAGCGSAAVDVTTVPLSIAYGGQRQGAQLGYGINAALSVNAGGSKGPTYEAARSGARRHYVLARTIGYVERALPGGGSVGARAELQYSPHRLIPAEQYGIGGANSVRGYLEREVSGDLGYLLRLELSTPAPPLSPGLRLRPYLFLDHGRVRNHGERPCRNLDTRSCSLSGAGIGARLGFKRNVSVSLDVARALEHGSGTSAGDVRGHAAVNLAF